MNGGMEQLENTSPPRRYVLKGSGKDLLGESDNEITRLQALLSQWVRMENVVVLTGAGCSCSSSLGGKTLGDLENSVLDLLEVIYRQKSSKNLEKLITSRKASKDAAGFEQWLSYLSNVHYLLSKDNSPITDVSWGGEFSLSSKELSTLLKNMEQAIYAYCALTLTEPYEEPAGHHAFLSKLLARDPSLGRTHLFTINYDTVFEQALDHLGAQYQDGFVGKVRPRFDPSVYGLDIYYPGEVSEGRVRRYDKFLHFYKLHGSINWCAPYQDKRIELQDVALSSFNSWQQLEGAQEKAKAFSELFGETDTSIVILPTAKKFADTLELPYAHLFRIFHQRLQEPQTFLLIIGYGFGDDHINQIIDDAMLNPGLVLLVVNPGPNENILKKVEKYQSVGERAFFLHAKDPENQPKIATFDDFAKHVMPHVKSMDEWVRLRKLEKIIGAENSNDETGKGS